MLSVERVDGDRVRGLLFGGDAEEVAYDVLGLIEGIHYSMCRVDPKAAALFRLTVQLLVEDDESPVWAGKGHFNGNPIMMRLKAKGGKRHGNDV